MGAVEGSACDVVLTETGVLNHRKSLSRLKNGDSGRRGQEEPIMERGDGEKMNGSLRPEFIAFKYIIKVQSSS